MRKVLAGLGATLLIFAGIIYLLREPLKDIAFAKFTADMFVAADQDQFDPGPRLGSQFPGIQAVYNGRRITLINEFAGENGTVLTASRSLDWCPYCMRQMIQLQEHGEDFETAGIGLVAITYDAPELQQAFSDKHSVTIPLLSDIDALSFKTLGILNDQYEPGDFQYGIPHPGMIVIDSDGRVVGKLFLEAYSQRIDSAAALVYAKEVLGLNSKTAD